MVHNLVKLNSDGTFPTAPIAVTAQGVFPKIGVTPDHRMLVEATIKPADPTDAVTSTTTSGTKTVAASATPEKLVASATKVTSVLILPLRTNTGDVWVGFASANNAQHAPVPIVIEAAEGEVIDISTIYVDVATNGEGVAYMTIS